MNSPTMSRPCASSPPRLMRAALEAAEAGHAVFPLLPHSKQSAVRNWESVATRDPAQIRAWWQALPYNLGIACGPSRVHVLDLDDGHGQDPPAQWPEARGGRDVLARLAEAAGQPYPGDTYTVASPTGGLHLYFRAPAEPELRSTVARLGWRIDTRGAGGYIVAAGSVRPEGYYRALNHTEIAPLPVWLVQALTPPPRPEPVELDLPAGRASAYVAAIVTGETDAVAQASTGARRNTLLRASGRLGQLVGGGELDEHTARTALHAAAGGHIGHDGFTAREAETTIRDGLAWGIERPRHVTGHTG